MDAAAVIITPISPRSTAGLSDILRLTVAPAIFGREAFKFAFSAEGQQVPTALVEAIGPVLFNTSARPNALKAVRALYKLVLATIADDHRVAILIGQVTAERIAGEKVMFVGAVQKVVAQLKRAALTPDIIGLSLKAVGHPLAIDQTVRALL